MSLFGRRKKHKKDGTRESFGKKKNFLEINDYEDEYDEYGDEESDEYYEDEYYEDEESEEYYEDEQYEDEESEEYYEDGQYEEESEEYYEDEQYEDEESEEYYEEDERYYAEDGEYEESEEYEEDDFVPYRKKKGVPAAILAFHRLPLIDKIIACTGVAVLFFAVLTGVVFMAAKREDREVRAFAEVGASLNGVNIIGESGLLAVADARLAREAMAEITQETQVQEDEVKGSISISMKMSSIVKDLKIKFVNTDTDKLVANVPFQVEVTTASKKTETWTDDDKDGIIYKENIEAGAYKVKMLALTGYDDYQLPQGEQSEEVKATIAYKKVDVKEEIKTEAEVNAALEEAVVEKIVEESKLTDTVPFVKSTQKSEGAATYKKADKGTIPDPATVTAAIKAADYYLMTVSDGNPDTSTTPTQPTDPNQPTDPTQSTTPTQPTAPTPPTDSNSSAVTATLSFSNISIKVGDKKQVEPSKKENIASIGGWTSSNTGIATVDSGGVVTGVAKGDATITATGTAVTNATQSTVSVSFTVTVTDDASVKVVGATPVKVAVNKTADIKVETTPTSAKVTAASSGDAKTATVKIKDDKTVTVTGVAKGTTKITITCDNGKSVEVEVTVANNAELDTTSLLKDKNGKQVYVYENGVYRKAVYADYYKFSEFYVEDAQKILYTGWQNIDGKTYYYLENNQYVTGEQVIQGAKYTFASDGSLVTGSGTFGIDVSKWNGNIDWNSVKAGGVSYAMIRCGYRGSSTGALIEDPKFRANIAGANAAGIKVGIYFFTQAVNEKEAVEEASMTLELIKKYKISYPVFLDVESGGRANGIDKGTRTAVCKAYCATIQNSGYTAGIYANKTWLNSKMDAGALSAYKIWLAQYAAAPSYGGRYNLWQYSDKGSVPGIKGNVDLNLSYLGY